jgi:hypothetical protein
LEGHASEAARYGLSQGDSGFAVIRNKKGKVLAQSWYWISSDCKAIIFDAFDTSGPENNKFFVPLILAIGEKLKEHDIDFLMGARGHNSPKLFKRFYNPYTMREVFSFEYPYEGKIYYDSSSVYKANSELLSYVTYNSLLPMYIEGFIDSNIEKITEAIINLLNTEKLTLKILDRYYGHLQAEEINQILKILAIQLIENPEIKVENKTLVSFILEKSFQLISKDMKNLLYYTALSLNMTDIKQYLFINCKITEISNFNLALLSIKTFNLGEEHLSVLITHKIGMYEAIKKQRAIIFIKAAEENDNDVLSYFLIKKVKVFDWVAERAFMHLVMNGRKENILFLIENNSIPEEKKNRALVELSGSSGNNELLKILLNKFPATTPQETKDIMLLKSVEIGNKEIIRFLIRKHQISAAGLNEAFLLAKNLKKEDILKIITEKHSAVISDENKRCFLLSASESCNLKILELLLGYFTNVLSASEAQLIITKAFSELKEVIIAEDSTANRISERKDIAKLLLLKLGTYLSCEDKENLLMQAIKLDNYLMAESILERYNIKEIFKTDDQLPSLIAFLSRDSEKQIYIDLLMRARSEISSPPVILSAATDTEREDSFERERSLPWGDLVP